MLDATQGRRKLIYIMFKAVYHKVLYLNALIKEARLGPRTGGGGGDSQDDDLDRDESPSGGESHKGPQAVLTTEYEAFTLSKDTWRVVLAFQNRRGMSSTKG